MSNITILNYAIGDIPILECVPEKLKGEEAPLVVFYHGWTSHKEESVVVGMELARSGFRAVLPDSIYHGKRHNNGGYYEYLQFVECLLQNVKEYDQIIDYYQERNLIKDNYVAVSGISMGGITACMLLTAKEGIEAVGVLMGSPQLLKLARHLINKFLVTDDFEQPKVEEDQLINFLEAYQQFYRLDLSLHHDKLETIPMFFWHGEEDDFVPFDLTKEFIEELEGTSAGDFVYFVSDPGIGHMTPYKEVYRMAGFLEATYTQKNIEDVWPETEKHMSMKFPSIENVKVSEASFGIYDPNEV